MLCEMLKSRRSEENPDAGFVHESIPGRGCPDPYAKIPHNIFTEFQVKPGEELVRLVPGRQRIEKRSGAAIVLQRDIKLSARLIGDPNCGLKVPALASSRSAQSAPYHRIQVELESTDCPLEDRPDFKSCRILLVDPAREPDLPGDTNLERKRPGFRKGHPRSQPPTHELQSVRFPAGEH